MDNNDIDWGIKMLLQENRELKIRITSLEAENATLRGRLVAYEVGYDPKVKLPEPLTIEWRGYPVFVVIDVNGYTHICDAYSKEYGFRATQGERVQFYSVDKVLRWFPLPDAKEEK